MEKTPRVGQDEAEGVVRDLRFDFERAEAFVIELLGGTFCLDVLRVEPHKGSGDEFFGDWQSAAISGALILSLGDGDLFPTVQMEFGEFAGEVVSVRIANGDIEGQGGSRIVAIIGEEG